MGGIDMEDLVIHQAGLGTRQVQRVQAVAPREGPLREAVVGALQDGQYQIHKASDGKM